MYETKLTLARSKSGYRKLLGVFLMVPSVAFNKWSVQALVTSDGQIDRRRDLAQNVALSVATLGFLTLLIELSALTGLIDYQQIFIPNRISLLGPHNRVYEPDGFYSQPKNDQYSKTRPGDAVLTFGARTRSGHFIDAAWSEETVMYFAYPPPDRVEARLAYLKELLIQGHALVRENGGKLLVAHIPIKIDVYRDLLAFPDDSVLQDWVSLELAAELKTLAEENGIGYMDLTPALRKAAADGTLVYFLDDAHWTPNGHQVAARAVIDHLTIKGWLD